MNLALRRLFLICAGALVAGAGPAVAANGARLLYPEPPRGNVVDTYWSTPVPDPYRPLESPATPEAKAWLRAEAQVTRTYLDALPYREQLETALRSAAAPAAVVTPIEQHGQFWSSTRRDPGKRRVFLVRDGALQPDRVLLDANALPPNVTVSMTAWSRSGRLFAYATQTNGTDWLTWHLRDVETASDLPDLIRWSKYGGVAFAGDDGLYYSGYDAPAPGHEDDVTAPGPYKAFYHRLGTPQSADVLLATAHASDEYPWNTVTEDGRYGVFFSGPGDRNGWDVFPADRPGAPRETLIAPGPGETAFLGNDGPRFFFKSVRDAPNGRIVEVDAGDPRHAVRTIVPEHADALASASYAAKRFFLVYLHDVHNVLVTVDTSGKDARAIGLPGLGSVTTPISEGDDTDVYYTYQSFTEPLTTFRYDVRTGRSEVVARATLAHFDASKFVTEQFFATSKDGTRVPVFVTHRRDMRYDGSTPTQLWTYGAFGLLWTVTPTFGEQNALWLEMGGAYAVVNARGGGEYGEAWHRDGMLERKQNGIDDVIAAAEMLGARKISSPRKIALTGASAGGLMVGAVVTQRPDLFGAAIPSAGVFDMLRYQELGDNNSASEYGSSRQSEAAFRTLYAYSPLQNVHPGTRYPAMLIMTGDHDDRVAPAHSYKFAAALQHAQAGDAPILLRVAPNAGHDYGVAGTAAQTFADRYAFLAKALDFRPALR